MAMRVAMCSMPEQLPICPYLQGQSLEMLHVQTKTTTVASHPAPNVPERLIIPSADTLLPLSEYSDSLAQHT